MPATLIDQHHQLYHFHLVETSLSIEGQIALPAVFREQDAIEPGQRFRVERAARGEYKFVQVETGMRTGLVDWLLACPEKGFFTPIESEATDSR